MGLFRQRLRLPLTCIAFGSISLSYFGIHLAPPGVSLVPLTAGELLGISLPVTVAWFSFSGACMLAHETHGVPGLIASWSRFAGQAAFLAGIPVWVYWYVQLVFGAF